MSFPGPKQKRTKRHLLPPLRQKQTMRNHPDTIDNDDNDDDNSRNHHLNRVAPAPVLLVPNHLTVYLNPAVTAVPFPRFVVLLLILLFMTIRSRSDPTDLTRLSRRNNGYQ